MSFTVTVKPTGLSFPAELGETVMAAAQRNGMIWPSMCGGVADCGVCFVEVVESDQTDSASKAEIPAIRRIAARPKQGGTIRLACQLRVGRDLTLVRVGVRRARAPA